MRSIKSDKKLAFLEERVLHYAVNKWGRELPEMRFFILDGMEFASLLHKGVYPVSPVNIWEGKSMINTRNRIETGQESSLYYEVVQTGNPSYAYLNENNNAMTQASVMAHVVGHCEFSELNIMGDSNDDRTEYIIYLTRQVELLRPLMGHRNYFNYWNACESARNLIAPNSQFNLERSIESDVQVESKREKEKKKEKKQILSGTPFSSTVDTLFQKSRTNLEMLVEKDIKLKEKSETLSRRGYKLRAPCEDILGFLRLYAPASKAEKSILDYIYHVNYNQDFVVRTQIMNEGWAMTWEKRIMMDLFAEKACNGIIDYCRIFSGVCFPRPWFQRNPYHLGFHMWQHIEDLYRHGKVNIDYLEETDINTKRTWKQPGQDPLKAMKHLVQSCTDYEFIRRFLSHELLDQLHLNRLHKRMAKQLQIKAEDVIREDRDYIWLEPEPVKNEMLKFFSHLYRPRLYIIDNDFNDGGLLIYHRYDERDLRQDWIRPTLKNINHIWKAPVSLLTRTKLSTYSNGHFAETSTVAPSFDLICQRMRKDDKPFKTR